ncbi:MAG: hypothetical protein IKA83_04305 [Paludibacteraceae bacterium]|nr:hypothetical protein [Paludibacteraceae bacterium]
MKKMIKLGLVSLLAVMVASCSSNDTCDRQCRKDCKREFRKECKMKKPCNKQFEKWVKFDSLSEQEQKELIQETKKAIDNREAKRKAYKDSIDALWKDFDNLSVDQQKSLLMHKMRGEHKPHKFHKHHKGMHCKKDFKKCPKGPRPECPRADAPNK